MTQTYQNYFKSYYEKNKETLNARRRAKYRAIRLAGAPVSKPYRNKNISKQDQISYTYEGRMWHSARARARNLNLPFNIEVSDIKIPKVCPILGIPLKLDFSEKRATPSLDRVIPEKGYVKGNIKVISLAANRMKSNIHLEFAKKLIKYLKHNGVKDLEDTKIEEFTEEELALEDYFRQSKDKIKINKN